MRAFRRLLAMPRADKVVLVRAWALLLFVRTALWVRRFPWTRRRLDRWREPVDRLVASRRPAARIARMVEIASHFVPGGRNCLTRAMTLETMLCRRGYPARLEIGVALADPPPAGGPRVSAHAWVTCGDRILIGGAEAPTFKSMTSAAR